MSRESLTTEQIATHVRSTLERRDVVTSRRLAALLGVDDTTALELWRGTREFTAGQMLRLSAALGVKPHDLLPVL